MLRASVRCNGWWASTLATAVVRPSPKVFVRRSILGPYSNYNYINHYHNNYNNQSVLLTAVRLSSSTTSINIPKKEQETSQKVLSSSDAANFLANLHEYAEVFPYGIDITFNRSDFTDLYFKFSKDFTEEQLMAFLIMLGTNKYVALSFNVRVLDSFILMICKKEFSILEKVPQNDIVKVAGALITLTASGFTWKDLPEARKRSFLNKLQLESEREWWSALKVIDRLNRLAPEEFTWEKMPDDFKTSILTGISVIDPNNDNAIHAKVHFMMKNALFEFEKTSDSFKRAVFDLMLKSYRLELSNRNKNDKKNDHLEVISPLKQFLICFSLN